jgi:hypothetical protein
MPRCCRNIFLNSIIQTPPDVIVDPPGASLCYHYEDVEFAGSVFDLSAMTVDYVTINGVQTAINKDIFVDWGWFGAIEFNYGAVVTDLAAAAITAGVEGMGFFMAASLLNTAFAFRFSVTGENLTACSITYTYDIGAGPVQATQSLTGSNCDLSYQCFEAEYTPENPFLIENGDILAVTNTGLTLFETTYGSLACPSQIIDQAWKDNFQFYIQTLHGTQASATIDFIGNTATVRIIDSLLTPAHMDNQADSGCTPPNSTPQVNLFTEITCP